MAVDNMHQGAWHYVQITREESVVPLELTEDGLQEQREAQPVNVTGKVGRLLGSEEEVGVELYIIETFDGLFVKVASTEVEAFSASPGEEGGFDAVWPLGGADENEYAWEAFGEEVCQAIAWKGFCVTQLTLSPSERQEVREQASSMPSTAWKRVTADVEAAYLGSDSNDKIAWLPPDAVDQVPEDALRRCDRALTELAHLVSPHSDELFGFSGYGRTGTMVRMPIKDTSEANRLSSLARPLTKQESVGGNGEMSAKVESYISFLQLRRICMIHFASGSGGSLRLHPKPGISWLEDTVIPIQENRLVLFRHDLLSYSYAPSGDSLALQAWLLSQPHANAVNGVSNEKGIADLRFPTPTYGKTGATVGVMSMGFHQPGNGIDFNSQWGIFSSGCDSTITSCSERWDHEIYFEPDKEKALGKVYAYHAGFVEWGTLWDFDAELFGIDPEEVKTMDPGYRRSCEVGYEALINAGFSRQTLMGKDLGVFVGHCGSDWNYFSNYIHHGFPRNEYSEWGWQQTRFIGRLHMIFGMKGPTSTHDTACSSSLVAVCVSHYALRPEEPGVLKGTAGQSLQWAMVMGCNPLVGPFSWIGLCAPKMISFGGRCFTFNQSADGFNRGEGFNSMTLKDNKASEEPSDRYAMLCGSCINQDGRSASMTAPHGPSQQECIRYSLREANITPADVLMAELHGTGTALGDPIELGALRGVMMWRTKGERRDIPIFKTSGKSNNGHLEASAGLSGLQKCVMMLMHGSCAPNVHLKMLNANADTSQYPVIITDSLADIGNSGYVGVSSFGVGGCNARGDVWARAQRGPFNAGGEFGYEKLSYLHARKQDFIDRANALEDPDISDSLKDNAMLRLRAPFVREEANTILKDYRLTELDMYSKPIPKEPTPLPIGPGTGKEPAAKIKDLPKENLPFNLERAIKCQHELIEGYSAKEFQEALKAGMDSAENRADKSKFQKEKLLEVQLVVLPRYGFEATPEGVAESFTAFMPFNEEPEVTKSNATMMWLTNPDLQNKSLNDFLRNQQM